MSGSAGFPFDGSTRRALALGVFCAANLATVLRGGEVPAAHDSPVEASRAQHSIVPGFERIYADPKTNATSGGLLLLGELGCASCHRATPAWKPLVTTKTAPILDRVGSRTRVEYLRKFIAQPQVAKPGTTMPELFAALPPNEAAGAVEALVHFLASTGELRDAVPSKQAARRGRELFETVGCVACHGPQTPEAARPPTSVPLGDLTEKYSLASLAEFLSDPLKVRPSGRMPALQLSPSDARAIADHFFIDTARGRAALARANLRYTVFLRNLSHIDETEKLSPSSAGLVAGFDLEVAGRTHHFALRFEGFLQIPQEGEYAFYLGSDDGSRLFVDGEQLKENDGAHPFQWREAKRKLSAGPHPIRVEYFQADGGAELRVEFRGPELARTDVSSYVTLDREKPAAQPNGDAFVFDAALASRGRELFATLGCASCHSLREGREPIASKLIAPALGELRSLNGCIDAAPETGHPRYALSARQRETLAAALVAIKIPAPAAQASADSMQRTMASFNCYACHVRGGLGGVESDRNAFFRTTQMEMGDEGRLPPSLDGVGDKLNLDYIRHIFQAGGEDRPYMLTRMPRFGLPNLEPLPGAFQTADQKPWAPERPLTGSLSHIKADGRQLVGDQALGCIKCHDFGKHSSTGVRAINMNKMTQRLRRDWFERYLLNPQAFRPGTRMPAGWPEGKTFFRKLLDGDTRQQIAAVWLYLSDGDRAAPPHGLGSGKMELVAETEPVIYRNFIEGAGPRAIGVGYPEKANLAFDADELRLALVWHGAFIDASRHWTGRGEGFQPPLGDHVLPLVKATPLAVLADPSQSWPTAPAKEQGYQFLGYRLDAQQRPTFLYRFQQLRIEDTPTPVPATGASKDPAFRRSLVLSGTAPQGQLWFLACRARDIQAIADGWYAIDQEWKLRVNCSHAALPVIRPAGSGFELLAPIGFQDTTATISEEFDW